jgi:hypothetical protein
MLRRGDPPGLNVAVLAGVYHEIGQGTPQMVGRGVDATLPREARCHSHVGQVSGCVGA